MDQDRSTRKLPDSKVAARYGVVTRTLRRWDDNPDLKFPRPLIVNGRKYRDENELDAWDRDQAARSATRDAKVA
jgi:hypothetical protein